MKIITGYTFEEKIKLCRKEIHDAEQVLGKTLGYFKYSDDPDNFPNHPNDDVCVGEHTIVTLCMEASHKIENLKNEIEILRSERDFYKQCYEHSS